MKRNIFNLIIIILLVFIVVLLFIIIHLFSRYENNPKIRSAEVVVEKREEKPAEEIVEKMQKEAEPAYPEFLKYKIKPREAMYYESRTFNEDLLEGRKGK